MATAKASTKIRKKNWHPLIAPKVFRNAVLGETLVYEPNDMLGKPITSNLMNLTGDIKRQGTNINFIVSKVEDGKAFTEIIGYHIVPTSVKRFTRRNSEKIELSFVCHTSDGKRIRIKPLIFGISNIKSSVAKNLRKTATDFLIKAIKQTTYDGLVNDLINFKVQNSLKAVVKKIYPVRVCQIRAMYLETEKKHEEETAGKEVKKEAVQKEDTKEIKEEPKEAKTEEKPKQIDTPKEVEVESEEEVKEVIESKSKTKE